MSTPVLVRLRPGLHKVAPHTIEAALAKPLSEIRKAHQAGLSVTIVSPDARTMPGRKKIKTALRHAGLEPAIVSLLGWATTYPGAEPQAAPLAIEPVAPVEPPAFEPEDIDTEDHDATE
jgi:hypothetical protein